MVRVLRQGIVVLGAIAVLAGCGDDSGDGGGGSGGASGTSGSGGGGGGGMGGTGATDAGDMGDPNDVGAGEICDRLAEIQCAAEADCCTDPGRTVQECEDAMRDTCSTTLVLDTIAANPIVGFDRATLKEKLDELEARTADCDTAVASWAITSDGFASSFLGTRDADEACDPPGGLGATVEDIGAALASCKNSATTACLPVEEGSWTCTARAAADGACFTDLNCVEGLYCDNSAGLFMGVCAATKAAGADCSAPNECSSFLCVNDVCADTNDVQAAYCLD